MKLIEKCKYSVSFVYVCGVFQLAFICICVTTANRQSLKCLVKTHVIPSLPSDILTIHASHCHSRKLCLVKHTLCIYTVNTLEAHQELHPVSDDFIKKHFHSYSLSLIDICVVRF